MSKPRKSKTTKKGAAAKAKKNNPPKQSGKVLAFLGVLVVLAGSGLGLWYTMPNVRITLAEDHLPPQLRTQYAAAAHNIAVFEKREAFLKSVLVSNQTLSNMLSNVQLDAVGSNFAQSKKDLLAIKESLNNWNLELDGGSGEAELASDGSTGTSSSGGEKFLPIVLYHYTPPDFEEQLDYLVQHHYTTITLAQAMAGLNGGPLPARPVVITFDDGYENQMQAFYLLKEFNMKATFFIINGGPGSLWCIGAGRKYHLSIQPPGGCGDAYLTWSQIKMLDASGLITIGGHTIDHENLASLTPAQQEYEIDASKQGIEQELGHPIYDFAYPYGAYDETTIQLVEAAGYRDAVTTVPSNYQVPGEPYTLRRIRDTETLPP